MKIELRIKCRIRGWRRCSQGGCGGRWRLRFLGGGTLEGEAGGRGGERGGEGLVGRWTVELGKRLWGG